MLLISGRMPDWRLKESPRREQSRGSYYCFDDNDEDFYQPDLRGNVEQRLSKIERLHYLRKNFKRAGVSARKKVTKIKARTSMLSHRCRLSDGTVITANSASKLKERINEHQAKLRASVRRTTAPATTMGKKATTTQMGRQARPVGRVVAKPSSDFFKKMNIKFT